MPSLIPVHGGTDDGPEPQHDFSSNANPLGPCPSVLAAVRAADLTRYPDPAYTRLRRILADHHGTVPQKIVVGAGASELILRLIRHARGSVHVLGPTFSEYARCARVEGRIVIEAGTMEEFLHLQRTRHGLGFVCWPNNPTGTQWPLDFLAAAARTGPLVVDLAYAPLCPDGQLAGAEAAAERAVRLYAPNKAFGLTGLRAAYAITPQVWRTVPWLAPAWVIDRPAEAFLAASVRPEALRWLGETRSQFTAWRRTLALALVGRGIPVRESAATFLLARVGRAAETARRLRADGIRVRDAGSFGLPEWIRLSAQPPEAQLRLLGQLDALRAAPHRP